MAALPPPHAPMSHTSRYRYDLGYFFFLSSSMLTTSLPL
jgi:hypothetical protein